MIISLLISTLFVYIAVEIAMVAIKHHKAHKFFATKSPNLPVLPNRKIFFGNLFDVVHKRKNVKFFTEMHEKLGDSFGVYYGEHPTIVTKDIDLIKLVELDEGHKHIERGPFYIPLKEYKNSIMQVGGEIWHRSRRVIGPALANARVRSNEISDDIRDIVRKVHDSLEMRLNKAQGLTGERCIELDLENMIDRYTMAVVFSIAYRQDNVIDFQSDVDKLVKSFSDAKRVGDNKLLGLPAIFPSLRPISFVLFQFSLMAKMRDRIVSFMDEIIRNRMNMKKKGTDQAIGYKRRFADAIVDAFLEKKITRDDLMGNMWAVFFAGYVTTSDTIICLIWQLATNREIQEKLRKTIIEEGIDADYVVWCIYETMRWHPASPLGGGRVLAEDVVLNGITYPAGSFVMPSVPCIHRDPKIWPEADKYKPERWADRKNFHPAAFMSLGLGPRGCPGGHLAVQEIKLIIEMLLKNYDIRDCDKTISHYEYSSPLNFVSYMDNPVIVELVPYQSL